MHSMTHLVNPVDQCHFRFVQPDAPVPDSVDVVGWVCSDDHSAPNRGDLAALGALRVLCRSSGPILGRGLGTSGDVATGLSLLS